MNLTEHILHSMPDIIGMIGVVMVLVGFFLLNTHKVKVLDMRYQMLNFIGSWLILFSLLYSWNLASVLIEIAWIMISMIGIYRSVKHRGQ